MRSGFLLSALVALIAPVALTGQVTAIKAGAVMDPVSGTAARNQVVLIEGTRVKAVGAGLAIPKGATVIDLPRSTLLPGYFDSHTHLCMTVDMDRDNGSYYYTTLNDPDSYRSIQGVANAKSMLEAGFTTVRDVGNEGEFACSSVRMAVSRGLVEGPTIINAGRIIAPYGGQFQMQPDKRDALAVPEYLFADTRDELLKAVRENIHYGAGVIKLVVDDQEYIYSPEDIKFVVDEAAKSGLKVASHVWTKAGAHNAVLAGVASLEHLNGITDEDLELAKQKGVVAVFTPFPEWVLKQFRGEDRGREEYRQEIDRLRSGYKIGVTIAFGTDAIHDLPGYNRGTLALTWIDSYLDAGLTPAALIQALTINAARLLGVDGKRGLIKPGFAADIVAVPGDPLADARLLKRVEFVMKNGRVVRRSAAPATAASAGARTGR